MTISEEQKQSTRVVIAQRKLAGVCIRCAENRNIVEDYLCPGCYNYVTGFVWNGNRRYKT